MATCTVWTVEKAKKEKKINGKIQRTENVTQKNIKGFSRDSCPQVSTRAHSIVVSLACAEHGHIHVKEFLKDIFSISQVGCGLFPNIRQNPARHEVFSRQGARNRNQVNKLL